MDATALKKKINIAIPDIQLNRLQTRLLNIYKREGASKDCESSLNTLTKEYYRLFKSSHYYNDEYKTLIEDAAECKLYHAYCLQDKDNIKVSLHVLPKGSETLAYHGSDTFSLTIVEHGTIRVKPEEKYLNAGFIRLLCRGDTKVGLPDCDLLQKFKAMSDVAVFLTIKINYQERRRHSLLQRFKLH